MQLELVFLITLQNKRVKLSPLLLLLLPLPSFFCSRVTYVIVLKFGTRKPDKERNIKLMLFREEAP